MNQIDQHIKNSLSFLDNEYVNASICLFLILYAGMIAPKLPRFLAKLFSYDLFKLFAMLLIVYISRKDTTIAIIAAVAVMVSLLSLNKINLNNTMTSVAGDFTGSSQRDYIRDSRQNRSAQSVSDPSYTVMPTVPSKPTRYIGSAVTTLPNSSTMSNGSNGSNGSTSSTMLDGSAVYEGSAGNTDDQVVESDSSEVTGWNDNESLCAYEKLNESKHGKKITDQLYEDIISLKNTMIGEVIKRKEIEESTGVPIDVDRVKQICKDVAYDFEMVHKNKPTVN